MNRLHLSVCSVVVVTVAAVASVSATTPTPSPTAAPKYKIKTTSVATPTPTATPHSKLKKIRAKPTASPFKIQTQSPTPGPYKSKVVPYVTPAPTPKYKANSQFDYGSTPTPTPKYKANSQFDYGTAPTPTAVPKIKTTGPGSKTETTILPKDDQGLGLHPGRKLVPMPRLANPPHPGKPGPAPPAPSPGDALPDLSCRVLKVTPKEGANPITYSFEVKNIGAASSPSFHIQFQILKSGNDSDAAMQTEDRNISGEAAGEAKQVDFNVPAGFSDRAVRLVIDYDNKVAENNEQNNSVAMSKVGAFPSAGGGTPTPKPAGLPDMAAVLVSITPKADGGMRYRFTVRNGGTASSPAYLVQFQILASADENDISKSTQDEKVDPQAPYDTMETDFEVPAADVKNAVRLLIDYNNQVEESNEQNNTLTTGPVGKFPEPGGQ